MLRRIPSTDKYILLALIIMFYIGMIYLEVSGRSTVSFNATNHFMDIALGALVNQMRAESGFRSTDEKPINGGKDVQKTDISAISTTNDSSMRGS